MNMSFTKMVDLARTPEDIKEEKDKYACNPVTGVAVPRYSYGTCLTLGNDELEKLGLNGPLPSVGDEVQFCARAKVTSASENESETEDGKVNRTRRIELQLTHMAVPDPDPVAQGIEKSEQRRERFYGKPVDDDGED